MPIALSSAAATVALTAGTKLALTYGPKAVKLTRARIQAKRSQGDLSPQGVPATNDTAHDVTDGHPCILDWSHGQAKWANVDSQGRAVAKVMGSALTKRVQLQEMGLRLVNSGSQQRGLLYIALGDLTGIPYQWGGQGTDGLDCSGSYLLLHEQLARLGLIRPLRTYTDRTAATMRSSWTKRTTPPLLGDAVIYNGGGHVEMWVGSGLVFGANGGNSKNKRGVYSPRGFVRGKRYDYWSKLDSVRVPR